MRILSILVVSFILALNVQAQDKFFTRDGKISFYSEAPLETIEAVNNQVTSVIDTKSGQMEFAVLIKAFQFEKALMQEHFNENYMESSTYPKSTFKGKITNIEDIDLSENGEHTVNIKGDLTIHGVTNEVETTGSLNVTPSSIKGDCTFTVAVADYKIEIPAVVRDNIAKKVDITVDVNYQPLKSK
jgi:polyisoprenoid-binding protein YceI